MPGLLGPVSVVRHSGASLPGVLFLITLVLMADGRWRMEMDNGEWRWIMDYGLWIMDYG